MAWTVMKEKKLYQKTVEGSRKFIAGRKKKKENGVFSQ